MAKPKCFLLSIQQRQLVLKKEPRHRSVEVRGHPPKHLQLS